MKHFLIRGIVRDYCLQAIHNAPDASYETLRAEVRGTLKADFSDDQASIWLPLMLALVDILLPILIKLFETEVE